VEEKTGSSHTVTEVRNTCTLSKIAIFKTVIILTILHNLSGSLRLSCCCVIRVTARNMPFKVTALNIWVENFSIRAVKKELVASVALAVGGLTASIGEETIILRLAVISTGVQRIYL